MTGRACAWQPQPPVLSRLTIAVWLRKRTQARVLTSFQAELAQLTLMWLWWPPWKALWFVTEAACSRRLCFYDFLLTLSWLSLHTQIYCHVLAGVAKKLYVGLATTQLDLLRGRGQCEAPQTRYAQHYWNLTDRPEAAARATATAFSGLRPQEVAILPFSLTFLGLRDLVDAGSL